MKKDFLTITPDSGGVTDVTAVADPNPLMKERSTTINFSSGGGWQRQLMQYKMESHMLCYK